MDPIVEALMAKYRMNRELAERIAANLQKPGASLDAYPGVMPATAAPAVDPMDSMVRTGVYHQQTAMAHAMDPGTTPAEPMNAGPAGLTPQDLEANQRLAARFAPERAFNQTVSPYVERAKRIYAFQRLSERAQNGEKLSAAESTWLKQVKAAEAKRLQQQADAMLAAQKLAAAPMSMPERDADRQKTALFFSPSSVAARAQHPDYWAQPEMAQRLREMEAKKRDMDQTNERFRSLNPKKRK